MSGPEEELRALADSGLRRSVRTISAANPPRVTVDGHDYLNFSSNDYLGLSRHPALVEAAQRALTDWGTGATASRLICGTLAPHRALEERIAALKGTEAALAFATGYATASGVITSVAGPGDTVIVDKLSHASLIDAARQCGATLRVFPHNNLEKLTRLLKGASPTHRTLVVTESVFSMDGDTCPLAEIVELKDKHGALLLLDEAHAVGVLGPTGQGLAEERGLAGRVDFQMGTLGKAVGAAGGYVATSRAWADLILNKARSFIYSTAPPPSQAAAAEAGLALIASPDGAALRGTLQENTRLLREISGAGEASSGPLTPIVPLIIGENEPTLAAAEKLRDAGFLVPAIRYPTVPRQTARLRLTVSAAHRPEHLEALAGALSSALRVE